MYGKYKHSVDPKGRLFVPSKLREELGEAFYVTLGLDHCLSVYTESSLPTPPSASRTSRVVS